MALEAIGQAQPVAVEQHPDLRLPADLVVLLGHKVDNRDRLRQLLARRLLPRAHACSRAWHMKSAPCDHELAVLHKHGPFRGESTKFVQAHRILGQPQTIPTMGVSSFLGKTHMQK